jgi:membrane protease subunit HflC
MEIWYAAMKKIVFIIFSCFFIISDSMFMVDQRKQAIVLQFGQFVKKYQEPGLKFKLPFIHKVNYYQSRVVGYDLPPISLTLGDQKRLVVDTYTRYRIEDPLLFFKSIEPATEVGARIRLETLISSTVRNVLGKVTLAQMLSEERSEIMHKIEQEVSAHAKNWGIEIIDVRIIRTELPTENRHAVFSRMSAELSRYANENRAKGDEKAQSIKANANRETTIILANAKKYADIIEAKAKATAIETTTNAYKKDLKFYDFYLKMKVNDTILDNADCFISTDGPLGSYIKEFASKDLGKSD